ncbi:MAG: 2-hydroxychromene-2-carboxylate isomerase [Deltaproteobacteria bacterium]|jgi:2-hydroxychromene-2-carboxylate isomerase|nr:2-hydroxychromene-2-carboxylate isomerase [Deltaproteobacteria bacterium]
MSPLRVDFHFDFSCPYAYLGSTRIESLCTAHGVELRWQPFLLGGVLRALGAPDDLSTAMSSGKRDHNRRDMQRWASHWGVELAMPSSHPQRTVRALRALLSAPEASWPTVIHAIFRGYWVDGLDITSPAILAELLASAGLAPDDVRVALAANDDPAIKTELRRRTDEALELGVFGAPTTVIHGGEQPELYWGQDRLPEIDRRMAGRAASTWPQRSPARGRCLDFYYDFSSPFAYLACAQIEAAAAAIGAELHYKPMLLGGLFRAVGTADVPLFEMSESKQRYQRIELERTARTLGIDFQFATNFPIRSILPLRVALAADERIADVSRALFAAAWSQGHNIESPDVLASILAGLGLDGAELLARAQSQPVKDQLRANTEQAAERGVFGAPTMVVTEPGDEQELYWGGDRLALMVERHR